MVLLTLGVPQDDNILNQIAYTESELAKLHTQKLGVFKPVIVAVVSRIKHQFYLEDYVKGSTRGPFPQCGGCRQYVNEGNDGLIAEMVSKYRLQQNSFDKTFRYCLKDDCLKRRYPHCDMPTPMPRIIHRGDVSDARVQVARTKTTYDII